MVKSFSPFSESLQMRRRTTRQRSPQTTLLSLIQKRGKSQLQTAAPPGGGDATDISLLPIPKSRRQHMATLGASLRRGLQSLFLLSSFPLRVSSNRKAESKDANVEEPKTRKKPGPKPGWKKKIKCERYWRLPWLRASGKACPSSDPAALFFSREELPNIYKCPYQGCTAVYRGADGMKVSLVALQEKPVMARGSPRGGHTSKCVCEFLPVTSSGLRQGKERSV